MKIKNFTLVLISLTAMIIGCGGGVANLSTDQEAMIQE